MNQFRFWFTSLQKFPRKGKVRTQNAGLENCLGLDGKSSGILYTFICM